MPIALLVLSSMFHSADRVGERSVGSVIRIISPRNQCWQFLTKKNPRFQSTKASTFKHQWSERASEEVSFAARLQFSHSNRYDVHFQALDGRQVTFVARLQISDLNRYEDFACSGALISDVYRAKLFSV